MTHDLGAFFSPCRRYRYALWRQWDPGPTIAFCMLNPSTADEVKNDATVERCERRAREWKFGTLVVVNLFAWRSTDPEALRSVPDPHGPRNFEHIEQAVRASTMFVCGWGKWGALRNAGPMLLDVLRLDFPGRAHALRINVDGSPAHPLYLPYSLKPEPIA